MMDQYPSKFRFTELDPCKLSIPFLVQTNWHVISAASSSGKTTLINVLIAKGHKTSPEAARQFLEQGIAEGRTIAEQRKDLLTLNRAIMHYTLELESKLPLGDTIFLDRGFPDYLSYCRLVGLDPIESLPGCFQRRYATVFILDRLPFQHDGVRYKDDFIAAFLHQWTITDYLALGYNPIKVPVLPPEERIAFIFQHLSQEDSIINKCGNSHKD